MSIVTMPPWIYGYRQTNFTGKPQPHEHMGTYCYDSVRGMVTEEGSGGLYVYYVGVPYPEKFACEQDAMGILNIIKRFTVLMLRTIPYNIPLFLKTYNEACWYVLAPWMLRPDLNCKMAKEIKMFVFIFLREYGIPFGTAFGISQIIEHFFEYDIGYRYPLQDMATETYQGALMNHPRRELKKLVKIYLSRTKVYGLTDYFSGRKVEKAMKLLTYLLLIPKVKRCFIKALWAINFSNIQFDEADRYHVMLLGDYNYFGLTFPQRWANYIKFHGGLDKLPPRIGVTL